MPLARNQWPIQACLQTVIDDGGLGPSSISVSVRRDESRWRMAFPARVVTLFGGLREMFTAELILNGLKNDQTLQREWSSCSI
jgi:hypothetical protein